VTLQRALLASIIVALLAGLLPAGVLLHRRLERELVTRARSELAVAPRVVADRSAATGDALMMHAKEIAAMPELAAALMRRDRPRAERLAADAARSLGDADGVVIARSGDVWRGPPAALAQFEATQRGQMPVLIVADENRLVMVALAPVRLGDMWLGAAGVTRAIDAATADGLAAVTRSDIVIIADTTVVASTLPDAVARGMARATGALSDDDLRTKVLALGARRFLTTRARFGDAGQVVFARDLDRELAVLPQLRRVAGASAAAALGLSLLLAGVLVARLTRSVRSLADAADRVAAGDFSGRLRPSRIRELRRVGGAFDAMQDALSARLAELETANAGLAEHSARLSTLQAELIQRDRLTASSHLVAQLAHEIRNPVANLRNCLEVIRKRLAHDERGRDFAELAIDELLRMHHMAEQLLDLNRPRDPSVRVCDATEVAREVVALATAGVPESELRVTLERHGAATARIAPDALKQVLLNVVRNAREAIAGRGGRGEIRIGIERNDAAVVITVRDDGPGIPAELRDRIFDPFVSTKDAVHGVGLGLYVAEGLVRTAGGRIAASNNDGELGACFRIELPVAPATTRVPENVAGHQQPAATRG
jgi:two-component system nitrogen regulation sensor histidine kinase NtrY